MTSEDFLKKLTPVTDKDFYSRVLNSSKPAVVLFTEKDNSLNDKIREILETFLEKYKDKINFFFVDVKENSCATDFGISNFPALIYFRESMELDRHDFIPSPQMLEKALKRILREL